MNRPLVEPLEPQKEQQREQAKEWVLMTSQDPPLQCHHVNSSNTTTTANRTSKDRLLIYSSFCDNLHGSQPLCTLLAQHADKWSSIQEIQVHAYYLAPGETLPFLHALVQHVLIPARSQLTSVQLHHLRWSGTHDGAAAQSLGRAMLQLPHLTSCVWDPLPPVPLVEPWQQSQPPSPQHGLTSVRQQHPLLGQELQELHLVLKHCRTTTTTTTKTMLWPLSSLLTKNGLPRLQTLRLTHGHWSRATTQRLVRTIIQSPQLHELDLQHSTFVGRGAFDELLHVLGDNQTLVTLDLCGVVFKDEASVLPHSSWPTASWQGLIHVLEAHNTTLCCVREHVSCATNNRTKLQALLAWNRSGIRQDPTSVVGVPRVWHYCASYSPTITFQMVRENAAILSQWQQPASLQRP